MELVQQFLEVSEIFQNGQEFLEISENILETSNIFKKLLEHKRNLEMC